LPVKETSISCIRQKFGGCCAYRCTKICFGYDYVDIIIIIIINKDLTIEIQLMWNVKNKGDTSNNRGDWDYLKVI